MPASIARVIARSWTAAPPRTIKPPTAPQPNPSTDNFSPERPKVRVCMASSPQKIKPPLSLLSGGLEKKADATLAVAGLGCRPAASLPTAGVATRRDRNGVAVTRRDHLDAVADTVLGRDLLVLHALGRDHDGLRHHHGLVLRGHAMGND